MAHHSPGALHARAFALTPRTYDDTARTIDVVLSTGVRGQRTSFNWDTFAVEKYEEELDLAGVQLDRANTAGLPLLNSHSWDSGAEGVIGKVLPGTVRVEDGALVGTVRFAPDASLDDEQRRIVAKIADGTLSSFSVGYNADYEKTSAKDRDDGGTVPLWRAVRWEPMELSVVPMSFDYKALSRSGVAPGATHTPLQGASAMNHEPKTTPVPSPQPPAGPDTAAAVRAENKRLRALDDAAARAARLAPTARQAIDAALETARENVATDPAQFSATLLDIAGRAATADVPPIQGAHASITRDEMKTVRDGVTGALVARITQRPATDDNAQRFGGHTLLDLGRALLHAGNTDVATLPRLALADRMVARAGAMMTSSDFPSVLLDAMNKSLNQQYLDVVRNWLPLATRRDAADFRSIYGISVGSGPAFNEIPEGGDYEHGTFGDHRESYALKTYGRKLVLSRQMLVNDDLGAFADLSMRFAVNAANKETELFWLLFTDNPVMGDSYNVFSSQHANTSGAAAAPSATTIDAGFQAMAAQKDLDNANLARVEPAYIVVPANYRATVAGLLSGTIVPAQASNVIPGYIAALQYIVEYTINAAQWFLCADPRRYSTIQYSYLGSAPGVQVEELEMSRQQGIAYGAWIDFGCAVVDYRGLYRNAA